MTAIFPRLLSLPKSSFFLFGPRGSGKTTWLREHFPRAHWVDLLDEARYQRYLADISLFERELRALPEGSWAVVDEIQRLPSLLSEVHRAIEGVAGLKARLLVYLGADSGRTADGIDILPFASFCDRLRRGHLAR
jgi:predicted AAA+ superfamily ATPase